MKSFYLFFDILFCHLTIFYYLSFASSNKVDKQNKINSVTDSIQSDTYNECVTIQKDLFHDHAEAKLKIRDWNRLLPRVIYSQTHKPQTVFSPTTNKVENSCTGEGDVKGVLNRLNFIGPLGPNCKTELESYGKGHGEKRVCGLKSLISKSKNNQEFVIYSIGSSNEWSFEESIFNNTNCKVEVFDCTVNETVQPPKYIRSRVRLHRICLSNNNNGLYRTWESLHQLTGLKGSPLYLKMDIEGFEYPVMQSIIDSGVALPLQISMEIHLRRLEPPSYKFVPLNKAIGTGELISFMRYLQEFGGYYTIDRRDNLLAGDCSEILLAKLDCHTHPIEEISYQRLIDPKNPSFSKIVNETLSKRYYS